MITGKAPNIFGPGVAVDRSKVDAEMITERIRPAALQKLVEMATAIRVGYVIGDDAIVDNVAAKLRAKADKLPLDAIALTIDPDHQDEGAGRNSPADVVRSRRAVAKLLPWRRFGLRLVSLAGRIRGESSARRRDRRAP